VDNNYLDLGTNKNEFVYTLPSAGLRKIPGAYTFLPARGETQPSSEAVWRRRDAHLTLLRKAGQETGKPRPAPRGGEGKTGVSSRARRMQPPVMGFQMLGEFWPRALPRRTNEGVFDMPALEGLASEPGSGQPELGLERPVALFDVVVWFEPG
jgi:hypothetical protein